MNPTPDISPQPRAPSDAALPRHSPAQRYIRPPTHALLDAISATLFLSAPVPPRYRTAVRLAGVGVATYSAMTRYGTDRRAPLSMRQHLALDAAQGAAFVLAAATLPAPRRARLGALGYGLFSLAAAALTDRQAAPSTRQIPMSRSDLLPRTRPSEVAPDVSYMRLGLVNVVFLGDTSAPDRGWLLVDAGLPGTAGMIRAAAQSRFGPRSRPAAILLTHGHFDHVGALRDLADGWDCPIFAHPAEYPHLDGSTPYPPARTTLGGGLIAASAALFPRAPIDVSDRLQPLPPDGSVPHLPGWRWLHTPGHTAGHVSFWRGADRLLLAGDAVITTRQESLRAVVLQSPELHGPPVYFTPDPATARRSIATLAALAPRVLLSGHGRPLAGDRMAAALALLPDIDWVHR